MQTVDKLAPAHLRAAVTAYRDVLRSHQGYLNRLNVYPVPDGDTGTNMALTLESVVNALDGADDMGETCQAIAHGSLMGARGNSGVILSQVLRGLADTFRDAESVGPAELAEALQAASDAAYRAVMRPVEGTILTVVAAAAAGAGDAAGAGKGMVEVLDTARREAADALARTPELLAVLAQAGVVDAGGAGLVLLLDALLHVAAGRSLPEPPADQPVAPATDRAGERAGAAPAPAPAADHPRYEVMFLLEAAEEAIAPFQEAWAAIGDSIVVVGGDGMWNCHIHTDDAGAAVEAALDAGGRPRRVRITDLTDEVEEERWVREAAHDPGEGGGRGEDGDRGPATDGGPRSRTAVVAVAAGDGLARIFGSLGAHHLAGGQCANPSTAEILAAVEAAPADHVVVLPNNKNVIPVAEQVDGLTTKTIRVVPTTDAAEGLAALLGFDRNADADANLEAMAGAAGNVVSGEVTRAVRSSETDAGPVADGDWLGLCGGRVTVVAPNAVEAVTTLLGSLVQPAHELVTLIAGEDATAADTDRIVRWLERHCTGIGVELHHGGQPHYPYLFSIE